MSSEREDDIVRWVDADGRVALAELAAHYGVSEMTVRRDLDVLTAAGRLQRVRGGAVRVPAPGEAPDGSTAGLASARGPRGSVPATGSSLDLGEAGPTPPAPAASPGAASLPGPVITSRPVDDAAPVAQPAHRSARDRLPAGTSANAWERGAVAALADLSALGHLEGGAVVLLTGGPGSDAVARRLAALAADRAAGSLPGGEPLTVVVTAVAPAAVLAGSPGVRLVVLGGEAEPHTGDLAGPAALAALADLHVDLAVLTPTGLETRGAWASTSAAAQLHAAVAAAADRVVALVGPRALGRPGRVRAVPLTALDRVVAVAGEGSDHDDVAARLRALGAGAPSAPVLVAA